MAPTTLPTTAQLASYMDAAVACRLAPTWKQGQVHGRRAARLAERFGINEAAQEDAVLARVYRTFSEAELRRCAADPVTRKYARAELARRGL
jgi:hypothetical protein